MVNRVVKSYVQKFKDRIERIKENIPQHVMLVLVEELKKLMVMKSDECSNLCNYIDWLTTLPWGIYSDENCDVMSAEKILEEDHYGLSNVKERVFEHIASVKLGGTSQGGLSMPPLIRGSPRTISTIPGKMVQCIKRVGTFNPVVLIDEIDKLGRPIHGETLNSLLELLDPELNANFLDHYLNVTIDLSKVLFICTANSIDAVLTPLSNRMEVITISGYLFDEKMRIVRDHLEKTARIDCGIKPEQVDLSDAALRSLIETYCIEPGVKNLRTQIEQIYRKSALKRVRDDASDTTLVETVKKVLIDNSNLVDYVGKPIFDAVKIGENIDVNKIYEQTPVGVAVGLSQKSIGYIETNVLEEGKGKGGLDVMTGPLGYVMKESAQIAYTFARRFLLVKEPKNRFFVNSKLHINGLTNTINEVLTCDGTTILEGPSGGCTIITSLLSLAIKKPVRKDLAMTGAVTLTGRILPIGAVMEKTLAARRSQVKTIIFPVGNRKTFEGLPQPVKEGLEVHFVDEYEQIFELAFNYAL